MPSCYAKSIKIDRTYYEVDDILELEGLTYNSLTDTVILNNYNGISIQSENDLNIILEGENTLNNDRSMSSCIKGKNITISGEGSISLISNSAGIYGENISINDTNINFNVKTVSIIINSEDSNNIINNSKIISNSEQEFLLISNGEINITKSNLEITCLNLINSLTPINIDNSEILLYINDILNIDNLNLVGVSLSYSSDNLNYHEEYLEDDKYIKLSILNDIISDEIIIDNEIEDEEENNNEVISEEIVTISEDNSIIEVSDDVVIEKNQEVKEDLVIKDNINKEDVNNFIEDNYDNIKNDNIKEVINDNNKNINEISKISSNHINVFKKYLSLFISYIGGLLFFLVTKRRVHG